MLKSPRPSIIALPSSSHTRGNDVRSILDNFAQNTSIGALPQSYVNPLIGFKIMWFVVFVAGIAGMSYHTYTIIDRYQQYLIQVKVSLRTDDTLEFPAVTICNLNPVKKSKIGCGHLRQLVRVQDSVAEKIMMEPDLRKIFIEQKKSRKIDRNMKMDQWIAEIMKEVGFDDFNIDEMLEDPCANVTVNETGHQHNFPVSRKKRQNYEYDYYGEGGGGPPTPPEIPGSSSPQSTSGPFGQTSGLSSLSTTGHMSTTDPLTSISSDGPGSSTDPTMFPVSATDHLTSSEKMASTTTGLPSSSTNDPLWTPEISTNPGGGQTISDPMWTPETSTNPGGGQTTSDPMWTPEASTNPGGGQTTSDPMWTPETSTNPGGGQTTSDPMWTPETSTNPGGGQTTSDPMWTPETSTNPGGGQTTSDPMWTPETSTNPGGGQTTSDPMWTPETSTNPGGGQTTSDPMWTPETSTNPGGGLTTSDPMWTLETSTNPGGGQTTSDLTWPSQGGSTTNDPMWGNLGGSTTSDPMWPNQGGSTTSDQGGAQSSSTNDPYGYGGNFGGYGPMYGGGGGDYGGGYGSGSGGGGVPDWYQFGDYNTYGDSYYYGGPVGGVGSQYNYSGSGDYSGGGMWSGGGEMWHGGDYGWEDGSGDLDMDFYFYDNGIFSGTEIKEEDKYSFKKFVRNSKLQDLQDVIDLVSLSPDDYAELGYNSSFILECTYDRSKCNQSTAFYQSINKRYGNCFTFNTKFAGHNHRTRKSGSQYGLRLTLDIESEEYLGLLASEYGVRVSIHGTKTKPQPEDDGFVAPPGILTSVAVRRKEVVRLPHPYESNCTSEFPDKYIKYADRKTDYSIRQCQLACLDYHLDKECGCVEQQMEYFGGAKVCDLFVEADRTCRARIHGRLALPPTARNTIICHCPANCKDVSFETGISQTEWPSDPYRRLKMINFYGSHELSNLFFEKAFQGKKGTEWVKKNLARVHVYYESLTYEIIEEQEAYPKSQLIADFGGIIGLYLGMSAVTLVEVVQLLILLCMGVFGRKKVAHHPHQYPPMEQSPARDNIYTGQFKRRSTTPGVPPMIV